MSKNQDANRVAVDLIFASLDHFDDRDELLTVLFGLVAHFCHKHGIGVEAATRLLQHRFLEYQTMLDEHPDILQ